MKPIPPGMSFEQYQIVTTNLRMQDMAFAIIVPGHAHFKVKDPKTAYTLLGLRSAAFIGMYSAYYSARNSNFNYRELMEGIPPLKSERNLFIGSLALAIGTYFFDWIHATKRLKLKQDQIHYHFGIRPLPLDNSESGGQIAPSFNLKISF